MSGRENAETKGRRYLAEGRLHVQRVDERGIVARCRGAGEIYRLGFDPPSGTWRCSCAALGRCSHLVALQLVTRRPEVA